MTFSSKIVKSNWVKAYFSEIPCIIRVAGVFLELLQRDEVVLLLQCGGVVGFDAERLIDGLSGAGRVSQADTALGHADVALDEGIVDGNGGLGVIQGLAELGKHHVTSGTIAIVSGTVRGKTWKRQEEGMQSWREMSYGIKSYSHNVKYLATKHSLQHETGFCFDITQSKKKYS